MLRCCLTFMFPYFNFSKNMDNSAVEPEELEVTVEVVPQTVNEIVYMTEDITTTTDSCYIQQEDDEEEEPDLNDAEATELYEIGSVDAARLTHMSLVLDQSQSFVLLPQNEHNDNEVSLYEYVYYIGCRSTLYKYLI